MLMNPFFNTKCKQGFGYMIAVICDKDFNHQAIQKDYSDIEAFYTSEDFHKSNKIFSAVFVSFTSSIQTEKTVKEVRRSRHNYAVPLFTNHNNIKEGFHDGNFEHADKCKEAIDDITDRLNLLKTVEKLPVKYKIFGLHVEVYFDMFS
ncbi:MAG: hypothetical protein GY750_03905 [Lentisphaerae bacterium]|nr:hypothetical protein [Lentisphaerota bacterium]MCP4100558.1 hypothetical protein [Lentisphaerota bacterium]